MARSGLDGYFISYSSAGFTSKRYPSECRLQASNFIQLLCHTSVLTLQMFISYVAYVSSSIEIEIKSFSFSRKMLLDVGG